MICQTRNWRITITGRSRSRCKGKGLCFKNSRWKNGKDKSIDRQNFRSCFEKCHFYFKLSLGCLSITQNQNQNQKECLCVFSINWNGASFIWNNTRVSEWGVEVSCEQVNMKYHGIFVGIWVSLFLLFRCNGTTYQLLWHIFSCVNLNWSKESHVLVVCSVFSSFYFVALTFCCHVCVLDLINLLSVCLPKQIRIYFLILRIPLSTHLNFRKMISWKPVFIYTINWQLLSHSINTVLTVE